MRILPLLLAAIVLAAPVQGQQSHPVIPLWPGTPPGSHETTVPEAVRIAPGGDHVISSVHHPSITVYLPAAGTATGAGVLVIPGGGHREIWIDHEGYAVAEWLSQHGIAAFVLKYRLAREPGSTYTVEGTELASSRYDSGRPGASDTIDRQGSKPAFQALIYPGIPHDMHLSKETPPAFLACGAQDRPDISEGLPQLYLNMKRAGAQAELHIFAGMGHGFGIRSTNPANVAEWPDLFYRWLESLGLLKK
jgi:acetyl esterase/lipase